MSTTVPLVREVRLALQPPVPRALMKKYAWAFDAIVKETVRPLLSASLEELERMFLEKFAIFHYYRCILSALMLEAYHDRLDEYEEILRTSFEEAARLVREKGMLERPEEFIEGLATILTAGSGHWIS